MRSPRSTASGGAAPSAAEIAAAWPAELVDLLLVVETSVDSTQSFARRCVDRLLAEGEDPPPFVVAALEQTAGRGRRGRAWQSAPGLGVWATVVLPVTREMLPSVPMRTGVALVDVCERFAPSTRLKWPNDLVCGEKKLGGLLVDAVGPATGNGWVLVGFGIDCFHRADQLPEPTATSLGLASGGGSEPLLGLAELLPRCVGAVLDRLQDRDDWLGRYRQVSAHAPGDAIVCALEGERVEGRFVGFDERGFLRLATATGERVLSSGDVFSW